MTNMSKSDRIGWSILGYILGVILVFILIIPVAWAGTVLYGSIALDLGWKTLAFTTVWKILLLFGVFRLFYNTRTKS